MQPGRSCIEAHMRMPHSCSHAWTQLEWVRRSLSIAVQARCPVAVCSAASAPDSEGQRS